MRLKGAGIEILERNRAKRERSFKVNFEKAIFQRAARSERNAAFTGKHASLDGPCCSYHSGFSAKGLIPFFQRAREHVVAGVVTDFESSNELGGS